MSTELKLLQARQAAVAAALKGTDADSKDTTAALIRLVIMVSVGAGFDEGVRYISSLPSQPSPLCGTPDA